MDLVDVAYAGKWVTRLPSLCLCESWLRFSGDVGATIDNSLVSLPGASKIDFGRQVNHLFMPCYVEEIGAPWNASTALLLAFSVLLISVVFLVMYA